MTKHCNFIFCFVSIVLGSVAVHAQGARAGQISVEPYKFRTYDGKERDAELGRLWVEENREEKSAGRLIQLAFVRLKSTAPRPGAPIVFLAGGPGIPGISLGQVPVYYSLFEKLREVSDVILLDQRGTGMSSPNLQCPAAAFSPDAFETTDKWVRDYSQFVKTCADHWRPKADLAAYNSNQSADDLEDLRRALGAERVSLLGWSYGTELALAAVRRHGGRLDRVVLASTRGADNLLKMPSVWDSQVRKLSRLAAADPAVNKLVPDMESLLKRVFDQLERAPVDLEVTDRKTGRRIVLRVGKIGLQTLVRADLSDARAFAALPALLYTVGQGDYSVLTRRMEQLYNNFGSSAMALATDCAAGWSAKRLGLADREARAAVMNNVNLQWRPEICKLTGAADLGAEFRARVRSKVPALFLSGTLDPNAPPPQSEEARRGFSRGVHLIVENAGHESLPAAEVQAVIVDFFRNQDVGRRAVSLPPPRFFSVEEVKSPPSRR